MIILFILLTGLSVGSFLNVLIDRLPRGKSILGRSKCDFCKKPLRARDLIPVVSFIALAGKCRYCKKSLSYQYPVVELLTGFLFVLTYLILNNPISNFQPASPAGGFQISNVFELAYHLFIVSSLIVIFFADFKYQIIPDKILILAAALTFGYIVFTSFNSGVVYQSLFDHPLFIHTITGILAFLFFLFIFLITRGRGMGLGDVKFAFLIGLILGPLSTVLALYGAFLTGAGIGIILILWKKKGLKEKIPFGPFLAAGSLISLLFTEDLVGLASPIF